MNKISLCLAICAALSIGVAHAQAPLGVDMTTAQANVAQLNAIVAQADPLKRPESAMQSTQVDDTNTRLLVELLNTQVQTLATLKAIEAKLK